MERKKITKIIFEKMEKILIGLVGELGSGKDTFCKYIKENYQKVTILKFSDALFDILRMFFDTVSREDLQWLGLVLKQKFGFDILVRALVRRANSIPEGIIILNGVREEDEAKAIRGAGGKIVYITAGQKLRWERVSVRGEKADDNAPFEKFVELEKATVDMHITEIGKTAEFKVENNGTKEDLGKQIKNLIETLKNGER